jgi:hypothetical protein
MRHPTSDAVHNDGADVHRRSFPPDRAAAEQPDRGQQDAPDHDHGFEEGFALGAGIRSQGKNRLRNAAAFGSPEETPGEPRNGRKSDWRHNPGPELGAAVQAAEDRLGDVCQPGEAHRGSAHGRSRAP